jgi:endonuclease/exonuclease/phosphatase family metal-dependent hydrolase
MSGSFFNPNASLRLKPLLSLLIAAGIFSACSRPLRSTAPAGRFVVMSYNIHHANPPSQPAGFIDLDTIAATIQQSGAELIAVQELDSVTERSNRQHQLLILADKLKMNYHFERTIPYQGGAYGIGILSKHPIQKVHVLKLPEIEGKSTEPRKLIVAEVNMLGKMVYFACTHTDYKYPEVNLKQMQELSEYLVKLPGSYPVIVGGDFNAVTNSAGIQWMEKRFSNASVRNEFTIPVVNPKRRIDFIFYRGDRIRFVRDTVYSQHNYGSDHLPIAAEFSW